MGIDILQLADPLVLGLAVLGLVGGVGISTLGPGGVLPTIGLFSLTDLTTAQVAGTAIVTHVGTGIAGTLAYARSGHLQDRETRRSAVILVACAIAGTPLGVAINFAISTRIFGWILGIFLAVVAVLLWWRERQPETYRPAAQNRLRSTGAVAVIGFTVAVASGIVGVGGPMLTVPLLIATGVPILESLAAAQVQSIAIAAVGSGAYLMSIDWWLAAIIGIPEVIGVVIGWKIATAVPARILTRTLCVVLLALAPYVAIG